MTTATRTAHPQSIEVAVFDHGALVSTRPCRGIGEARALMERVGADGLQCLIVSPALRTALARTSSR